MESVILRKDRFLFSKRTKERLIICIRFVCMFLFLYTAYAKIVDNDRFLNGLLKVHIINGFAVYISLLVPSAEVISAVLLLIPQFAKWGLYTFTCLMILFTGYICSALIWEKELPCGCGGAIEKLSWTQHIWFNLAFIAIAIFAIRISNSKYIFRKKKQK